MSHVPNSQDIRQSPHDLPTDMNDIDPTLDGMFAPVNNKHPYTFPQYGQQRLRPQGVTSYAPTANAARGYGDPYTSARLQSQIQQHVSPDNRQASNSPYSQEPLSFDTPLFWQTSSDFNDQLNLSQIEPTVEHVHQRGNAGNFLPQTAFGSSGVLELQNSTLPTQSDRRLQDIQQYRRRLQESIRHTQHPGTATQGSYQMPNQMSLSDAGAAQLASFAYLFPPASQRAAPAQSPHVGVYHQNIQENHIEPRNPQLNLGNYHTNIADSEADERFHRYLNSVGPHGYQQDTASSDKFKGGSDSNTVERGSSSGNTNLTPVSPTPELIEIPKSQFKGKAKQIPESVSKPSKARSTNKKRAEIQESDEEEQPVAKKRKHRSMKQAALESDDKDVDSTAPISTKPALRKPDGQLSESPYVKGGGIREPVPPKKPSGLFFDTYDEAIQGVGTLSWMPPANDPTLPSNDLELQPYVLELREAMKDMSAYLGRPGAKMKNRWLPNDWTADQKPKEGDTLQNEYNPEHYLERRAWDIAHACQRLHRDGPSFVDCLDPLLLEQSFEYKDLTFHDRMSRLIGACISCKDRVGAMLKLGMGAVIQFLLTPGNLVQASKGNRANNDVRQGRLVTGRLLEQQAKPSAEASGSQTRTQGLLAVDKESSPLSDYNSELQLESISARSPVPIKGKRKRGQPDVGDPVEAKKTKVRGRKA